MALISGLGESASSTKFKCALSALGSDRQLSGSCQTCKLLDGLHMSHRSRAGEQTYGLDGGLWRIGEQHEVARFDVPMQDAVVVTLRHGPQHRPHVTRRLHSNVHYCLPAVRQRGQTSTIAVCQQRQRSTAHI